MESRDWLNDYESLKQVSETNPFKVPAGYFDDLDDRIITYKYFSELKNKEADSGFLTPESYFDELAGNITSRINIEAVLETEKTGFIVPENYFGELSDNIQSQINIAVFLETEDAGFAVPEGYFDNLGEQIESRIFIVEMLGEPVEDFAVPHDYFAGLNQNILNKTVNKDKDKLKGNAVVKKLYNTTFFKYATAACFALAIGGGILISQVTSPVYIHKHSYLHKELSGVPLDDIKSYLQLNVDAGDAQQTVITEDAPVNNDNLKKALQNDIDSVQ